MPLEITALAQTRQFYYDTYANLPTAGLTPMDLGYATDRLVLYRWSGSAWEAITIHSSSGVAANIPTAADLPDGSLYAETDTGITKQVQSGSWVIIVSGTTNIKADTYTGNGAADRQIATGFACKLVIIQEDGTSNIKTWFVTGLTGSDCHMIEDTNIVTSHDTPYIHATDGFVVSSGADEANTNTKVYRYIAIG